MQDVRGEILGHPMEWNHPNLTNIGQNCVSEIKETFPH